MNFMIKELLGQLGLAAALGRAQPVSPQENVGTSSIRAAPLELDVPEQGAENALELEVDPRLLRLKESTEEDPSPSKKKALKYYKDQGGKAPMSRSQRRKKKRSLRQKTEIQRYIDSIDEYQQPPRRPIRLEDYMANLHFDSESEEETGIPIETCRVISHRGGRNGRGRGESLNPQRTNLKICPKEMCCTTSPFTDSDEELCFPEDKSKSKMTLKGKCPKLGSSSDSEEAEDVDNTEDSSEEVTQIHDTEEDDDISATFKPLIIGKRKSELLTVPFDYKANHANKVRCSSKLSIEEEEEFHYQSKGTTKSHEEEDPGSGPISKKFQKVSISMIRVSEEQISTNIIKIVPMLVAHSKTLTTSSNTNIGMLKTFYVPSKKGLNERGSLFYESSVIPHHTTHDMECEDEWEYRDMWIIIPQYPAPIMRKLMEKNIFFVQTNKRARYFRELWHNEHAQRPVTGTCIGDIRTLALDFLSSPGDHNQGSKTPCPSSSISDHEPSLAKERTYSGLQPHLIFLSCFRPTYSLYEKDQPNLCLLNSDRTSPALRSLSARLLENGTKLPSPLRLPVAQPLHKQDSRLPVFCLSSYSKVVGMSPAKSMMTINHGEGSRVQFPQTVIDTGRAGATLQFGTVSDVFEFLPGKTAVTREMMTENDVAPRPSVFSRLSVAPAANLLAKQKAFKPRPKQITIDSTIRNVNKSDVYCMKPNIGAFNISTKVPPLAKRKAPEPKLKSVIIDTANLKRNKAEAPDKTIFVPGRHDAEASTSGVKLSRKARRKANARLRARGWTNIPNPSQEPLPQPEANIPICNGFEPLRWVKRNNARGELKKSFWETSYQPQQPPERKESAASCLHKLLKAVKNRKLMRNWSELLNEGAVPTSRNPWKKEFSKRPHQGSDRGLPYFFKSKATKPKQHPLFERKPMGKSYGNLYHEGYKQRPLRPYYKSIPVKECVGPSNRHFPMPRANYSKGIAKSQQVWVPKQPKQMKILKGDYESQTRKMSPKNCDQGSHSNKKSPAKPTLVDKGKAIMYEESPDSPIIHWRRRSRPEEEYEADEDFNEERWDEKALTDNGYYDKEEEMIENDHMNVEVVRVVSHTSEQPNQRMQTRRNATTNPQNEEQTRGTQEQTLPANITPPQSEDVEEEEAGEVVRRL
ncbi:hypothetical protein M5K25_001150 [Dendrobium thyrsiflorum]|uniref:Uncharacterized protein n=1 Tax=Dendrobium thyrsiflorum TaxID=117978 RepID=A0ABD0VWT2_DENTH